MLRSIFVVAILLIGSAFAFQSPLYAAALYLWLAYFRPESWAWSGVFATLNLSYIAGVFLIFRTLISGTPIRINAQSGLLVAFLAFSLLSTALALDRAHSFVFWEGFAKTMIVSFLLTQLIRSLADLRLILIVIVLSLGFEAGKQGWAQLVLNPGAQNDNSIPFLGDNNLVAVGMAMFLPIVASLGATSTGWRKRAFQFLSVGVLYRGLSTYSRGGFLAVGAVGVLYFWRSPRKLRTLMASAIAIALIVPVLPPHFWDRMSTITAPNEERDSSQLGRLHYWQVAIDMANDRPLLGVGHSGFEAAYNRYDRSGGLYGVNRAVHSAWFGILAELGYPGLILFLTIIVSAWWTCRRVRLSARRGEIPQELGQYAIGLESALVAFVVGGSFVSFHYCEMLWHFFALTFALGAVAVREAEMEKARRAAMPAAPPAATAAVTQPEPEFAWG